MADVKTPLEDAWTESTAIAHVRRLQICCWIALIAIAAVRAWFTRYELYYADSISYLDIARAIVEGHPGAAIHAYWSPGYPVIVSFFFWVFRPNAYWEFPLVHLVNVLIFIGSLACFQLFWTEARLWHQRYAAIRGSAIPEAAFWLLGYAVFGIAILNLIGVGHVGPDMLTAAFCCLAGWGTLRFRSAPSIGRALLLGVVLALGYYAKAPLFPLGFIFLLCACLGRPLLRRAVFLDGIALATFLLICAPFIIALSHAKGRLTFGDAARISQALLHQRSSTLSTLAGRPSRLRDAGSSHPQGE